MLVEFMLQAKCFLTFFKTGMEMGGDDSGEETTVICYIWLLFNLTIFTFTQFHVIHAFQFMPTDSDSEDGRQAKAFISYYMAASSLCLKKKRKPHVIRLEPQGP